MRIAASPINEGQRSKQYSDIEHANHHDADKAQSGTHRVPPPSSNSSHVLRDNVRCVSSEPPRRSARQHPSRQSRDVEDAEHKQHPTDSQLLSTLISSAAGPSVPSSAATLLISDDGDDHVALLTNVVLDDDRLSTARRSGDSTQLAGTALCRLKFDSLVKNHTGGPIELPPGANLIGCEWDYKTERAKDGRITKHEARLVVSGNCQRLGIETTTTRDRANRTLTIRQGAYTRALIHRHEVGHHNTAAHPLIEGAKLKQFDGRAIDSASREYQSKIGGIMRAAVCTGPEIACAAARLSQYQQS